MSGLKQVVLGVGLTFVTGKRSLLPALGIGKTVGKTQMSHPFLCVCQIYPDEGHFLRGETTRQHLGRSLVNFFEECFRLPEMAFEGVLEEEGEDEG